jgi:arsenate reductase (thioredoxin)
MLAEAFAKKLGQGKFEASSAGNKPAVQVNPVVVEVMKEKGIDISKSTPKQLTAKMAYDADLVVTMGCNEQGVCPGPFFKPTIEWHLEDPKGKPIEKVRQIRDQIEGLVQELIKK